MRSRIRRRRRSRTEPEPRIGLRTRRMGRSLFGQRQLRSDDDRSQGSYGHLRPRTRTDARIQTDDRQSRNGIGQRDLQQRRLRRRISRSEEVTLAATAASGSTFSGWSSAGCSGTGSCKVTINADTTVTATFTANPKPEETCASNAALCPPPSPPPAEEKCIVPKLAKKSLSKAKSALKAAHCALGKVTKPKKKKKGALVVKSSKPGAGTTLAAGAKVGLKLGPKKKK